MKTLTPYPTPGGYPAWDHALVPEPAAPFTQTEENELERIKNRLLRQALAQVAAPEQAALLRRAANESAALAWLETHPLLVFPSLFEEKLAAAKRQIHKQLMVQARSSDLYAPAA